MDKPLGQYMFVFIFFFLVLFPFVLRSLPFSPVLLFSFRCLYQHSLNIDVFILKNVFTGTRLQTIRWQSPRLMDETLLRIRSASALWMLWLLLVRWIWSKCCQR